MEHSLNRQPSCGEKKLGICRFARMQNPAASWHRTEKVTNTAIWRHQHCNICCAQYKGGHGWAHKTPQSSADCTTWGKHHQSECLKKQKSITIYIDYCCCTQSNHYLCPRPTWPTMSIINCKNKMQHCNSYVLGHVGVPAKRIEASINLSVEFDAVLHKSMMTCLRFLHAPYRPSMQLRRLFG